jgi:uncharacterized coiled-coil DUF342 family protein
MEAAVSALEEHDLTKENAALRENAAQLSAQLHESREENAALRQARDELIHNFKHELKSKRLALLGFSERQYRDYLHAGLEAEKQRIGLLYFELQRKMTGLSAQLHRLDAGERGPLLAELDALREKVSAQIKAARERKDEA